LFVCPKLQNAQVCAAASPRAKAAYRASRGVAAIAGAIALMAALGVNPARAQLLPLQLTVDTSNGILSLSSSADITTQIVNALPTANITVALSIDLSSGFPLNCPGGVHLINLGNRQYGVSLGAATEPVLSCTLNTLNALQDAIGTIVPTLTRQNDFLMSLDIGLDRQISILSTPEDTDADSIWQQSYGLGAPMSLGMMGADMMGLGMAGDPWASAPSQLGGPADGQPSSYAFATSLRQSRQAIAAPPYALGAQQRPPAPATSKFDVWTEGYLAHFDEEAGSIGSDGHTGVLYVGADYKLSKKVLVGALVQFDETKQDFDLPGQDARTTGWMAGPYAMLRLPYDLFFQARAAWGQSDNEIGNNAGTEDHFDADRWLVRGTLVGQRTWGAWRLQPRASIGYIEETQESYTSGLWHVLVPGQTVSLGQAKAGSQLAYRQRLADGIVIEPSVLLEGIWNFHQHAGDISVDDLVTTDKLRARTEAGVMFYAQGGMAYGASVSYDGIGSSDYEAIGGRARVKVPLD
jgi:uncharacterized protein with beta-barrel porin domain